MANTTLKCPASDVGTKLILEAFLKPSISNLVVEEATELSLTTSDSTTPLKEPSQIWEHLSSLGASTSLLGSSDDEKKLALTWFDSLRKFTSQSSEVLKELDSHLQSRTFMVGKQLTAVDLAVFTTLHDYIKSAQRSDLIAHPSTTRHFDFVQNHPSIKDAIQSTQLSNVAINVDDVPQIDRTQAAPPKKEKKDGKTKEAIIVDTIKKSPTSAANASNDPTVAEGVMPTKKKADKEKKKDEKDGKKTGGTSSVAVDGPPMPHMIDMRIGKIIHVEKHPDADSLYVEKIDFGEAEPRTVVSGLVNYIPIEEMQDRLLVGICNLKPANMRGVKSFAMVLAATSKDGKGGPGSVELVAPPPGSQPGDRVFFEGFENEKPIEQLNPKKKQFEAIQPNFTTLESKDACWKDPANSGKPHRIMTERGVCQAPNFVGASLS